MVATESSAATRAIEAASSPSASATRITAATGVTLSMADLFNAPTPQDLDKLIADAAPEGS